MIFFRIGLSKKDGLSLGTFIGRQRELPPEHRLKGLQGLFTSSYVRANADMQAEIAYDPVAYDHDSPLLTHGSNMAISANQIANMFDCLSVTIEQPFKDIAATADGPNGWCHLRSKALGADLLVSTCVRTGVSARRAI